MHIPHKRQSKGLMTMTGVVIRVLVICYLTGVHSLHTMATNGRMTIFNRYCARSPPPIALQQKQNRDRPIIVHRGLLPGVHVHAASLLMSAAIDFLVSGPSWWQWWQRAGALPPSQELMTEEHSNRISNPVFLSGELCEQIHDSEHGHSFWVCTNEVNHEDFTCRRVVKNDKYVWYCTKNVFQSR